MPNDAARVLGYERNEWPGRGSKCVDEMRLSSLAEGCLFDLEYLGLVGFDLCSNVERVHVEAAAQQVSNLHQRRFHSRQSEPKTHSDQ